MEFVDVYSFSVSQYVQLYFCVGEFNPLSSSNEGIHNPSKIRIGEFMLKKYRKNYELYIDREVYTRTNSLQDPNKGCADCNESISMRTLHCWVTWGQKLILLLDDSWVYKHERKAVRMLGLVPRDQSTICWQGAREKHLGRAKAVIMFAILT